MTRKKTYTTTRLTSEHGTLLVHPNSDRRPAWQRSFEPRASVLDCGATKNAPFNPFNPPMTKPITLCVAAAQMKFADTIEGNLTKIEQISKQAARRKADVVLFPEAATTGYGCDFTGLKRKQLRDALEHVSQIARTNGIHLLVGSPVFKGRKLANCLVHFDREGRVHHCYAKCQLTPSDQRFFSPGNAVSLFEIDGIPATTIICHERRYPELVRLACMAGARIVFHPNAGMDALSVSKKKRNGNDGIAARAFENAVYYIFANSVGPQGGGKWSAGDSKIVAPDMRVLQLADNENEDLLIANLDLTKATGKYAKESLDHPRFLSSTWKGLVRQIKAEAKRSTEGFELPN